MRPFRLELKVEWTLKVQLTLLVPASPWPWSQKWILLHIQCSGVYRRELWWPGSWQTWPRYKAWPRLRLCALARISKIMIPLNPSDDLLPHHGAWLKKTEDWDWGKSLRFSSEETYTITVNFHKLIEDWDWGKSLQFSSEEIRNFLAKNHLRRHNISWHCIRQEIAPKGKVNVHSSRHTLIGLFGHCPEAKLVHSVESKAQI